MRDNRSDIKFDEKISKIHNFNDLIITREVWVQYYIIEN